MLAVYKLAIDELGFFSMVMQNNEQNYLTLALFRTVFEKLKASEIPFTQELNRLLRTKEGMRFIAKIQLFIFQKVIDADNEIKKNFLIFMVTLVSSKNKFERRKTYFENLSITKEEIEAIDLEKTMDEIFTEDDK